MDSDELTEEFFIMLDNLYPESECIISDDEILKSLNRPIFDTTKYYINIKMEQIPQLINIYMKKLFNSKNHFILYNYTLTYSYEDTINYINHYNDYLIKYEKYFSRFENTEFYQMVYDNYHRIDEHILFVKPKDFNIFKQFIDQYYTFIINRLKVVIKYLNFNIRLYIEPFSYTYFNEPQLLDMITCVNEVIAMKLYIPNQQYQINFANKIELICKIVKEYYLLNYTDTSININILLKEYYHYEYTFTHNNTYLSTDELLNKI